MKPTTNANDKKAAGSVSNTSQLDTSSESEEAKSKRLAAEAEQAAAAETQENARKEAEAEAKREAEKAAAVAREAKEDAKKKRRDAQRKSLKEGEVLVTVPKAFNLRMDHKRKFSYLPGTYGMPEAHATHRYAVANGVKIVSG